MRDSAECIRKQLDLPEDGRDAMSNLRRLEDVYHRAMAPDVPSYDVNSVQGADFDEWTYTEGLNCFLCFTQSVEINLRLMELVMAWDGKVETDYAGNVARGIGDKWSGMIAPGPMTEGVGIIMLPGDNMWHIVNWDNVLRYICLNPQWMIKPHPITAEHAVRMLKLRHGITRLYSTKDSGMDLLRQAHGIGYVTSSEMGIVAKLLGKPTIDFTLFESEQQGRYISVYHALRVSGEDPLSLMNRVMACPWSGFVPLSIEDDEAEDRFRQFKLKTSELRGVYKPVAKSHIPMQFTSGESHV